MSDRLSKAGYSLSVSRKAPIVLGMLLSMSMIACNYITTPIVIGYIVQNTGSFAAR